MKRILEADSPAPSDPTFSRAVVDWQKQHGRHALPWQGTRDAYRIWLSEIMLQQTQVAAVIPYYARFLLRFPDVATLAAAPAEDVMAHWSGLGYYTRARNLHGCAKRVMELYGGVFPSDPLLLAELPGIGRSTAAAISAFAYGTRAAILDGNVKRVFARVFGVEGYPGEKRIEDALWLQAVALLPADSADAQMSAYTQGLMDLGATLCTRSRPECQRCPLQPRCIAFATDRVDELPLRKPKKTLREKSTAMLVISDGSHVLLEQRPDSGIWGGLLSLPEIALNGEPALAHAALQLSTARFGVAASVEKLLPFTHSFTHFKLHVSPYKVVLARRLNEVGERAHVWLDIGRIAEAPLPAPVKKLLLALFTEGRLI